MTKRRRKDAARRAYYRAELERAAVVPETVELATIALRVIVINKTERPNK